MATLGVVAHPASAPRIGGQKYSEIVLHHLTIRQFAKIVEHLTDLFSGVVGSHGSYSLGHKPSVHPILAD